MWRVFRAMEFKYKMLALLTVFMSIGQVIISILAPNFLAQLITQVGLYEANQKLMETKPVSIDILNIIHISYKDPQSAMTRITIIFLVTLFVGLILGVSASVCANVIAVKTAQRLRANLFAHIQTLNAKKLTQISQPRLLTTFTSDIARIQDGILTSLRTMILGPIFFIGGFILALMTNLKFSISMAILIPLLLLVTVIVAIKGIPYFKKQQTALDAINLESQENIGGIKVIKSFNLENNQEKKYIKANDNWLSVSTRANLIQSMAIPVVSLIVNLSTLVIFVIAGIFERPDLSGLQSNEIQEKLAEYAKFLTSINAFIGYLWVVSSGLIMSIFVSVFFFRSQVSASRVWNIMAMKNSLKQNLDSKDEIQAGTIKFDNVFFKYFKDSPEYVLRNINLEIQAGQTIGIIGPTGSGKSSIAKLITHDWDVTEGNLLIDGIDITDYSIANVNKSISHVYQKPFLLSGTIRSNMLFGNPDATEEEIDHALKIAGAYDFVYSFNDGLDHPVSQGSTNLSGGQRQRIFIAQALLKNPKIIIFDDSTSALDNKTDKLVRQNIKKYYQDTTTIIISQKLSSIIECDKIAIIEDGQITAFDNHENLLKTNKYYREVAEAQLGGNDA
ncbi:ABC transporter ATP-binding protein [Mycoplasma sp. 1573]